MLKLFAIRSLLALIVASLLLVSGFAQTSTGILTGTVSPTGICREQPMWGSFEGPQGSVVETYF